MIVDLIWRHLGAPVARPGEVLRWGDRHPIINNLIRLAVALVLFAVLTLILSETIFPDIEALYFGDPAL